MSIAISGVGSGYTPPEHIVDQNALRAGGASQPQDAQSAPILRKPEIESVVKDLERVSIAFNKKLRFSIDSQTDEIVVKVVDPETDKVIKELPPEELQRLHRQLRDMIGLLFDETV